MPHTFFDHSMTDVLQIREALVTRLTGILCISDCVFFFLMKPVPSGLISDMPAMTIKILKWPKFVFIRHLGTLFDPVAEIDER